VELIEKALAKARAQQEAAQGTSATPGGAAAQEQARPTSPSSATAAAVAEVRVASEPVAATDSPLEEIRYVKTKVEAAKQSHWVDSRLVAANANDQTADIFRILRTKVLLPMRENGWQTVAIVGATPGVGKTTIASNLALSIALDSNQSVLLVDADLRRPKVADYFGIKVEHGLAEYLASKADLGDLLVNPGVERLVVLPSRGSAQNSTELLSSRRMQELLPELRNRYASRIVIFDLPPLLATGDALAFLHNFDCALLVVENGRNTAEELQEARRLMQGTNFLGWVLNKGDAGSGSAYYHYGATG
jgi:capsular exopolysaccharide synthesis family protein